MQDYAMQSNAMVYNAMEWYTMQWNGILKHTLSFAKNPPSVGSNTKNYQKTTKTLPKNYQRPPDCKNYQTTISVPLSSYNLNPRYYGMDGLVRRTTTFMTRPLVATSVIAQFVPCQDVVCCLTEQHHHQVQCNTE